MRTIWHLCIWYVFINHITCTQLAVKVLLPVIDVIYRSNFNEITKRLRVRNSLETSAEMIIVIPGICRTDTFNHRCVSGAKRTAEGRHAAVTYIYVHI